ncbi:hypothetical protein N431DRAFT_285734, partial [Stipitochalara longipes BDJ]
LIDAIGFPTCALSPETTVRKKATKKLTEWDISILNPKNRIDCAEPYCNSKLGWRIDGCADLGTRFFVIPITLLPDLPPLRIDLLIPDQIEHSNELRLVFESSISATLTDSRVGKLGISHHLCHVLDHWSKSNPNFVAEFRSLPFGSQLIISEVTGSKHSPILVNLVHDLERNLLSLNALAALWKSDILPLNFPPVIDLQALRLISQIQDTVSLVSIPSRDNETFIFKSNVIEPEYLYHELKVLLTLAPHPHLISKPLFLVTKRCAFGGKIAVCGFILPYYLGGALKDVLPSQMLKGTLNLATQIKWAIQITEVLQHIYASGSFYSDLRPENIVLHPCQTSGACDESGSLNAVLIDFEQRGNWYVWSAPEVLYYEYLSYILSTLPATKTAHYSQLFNTYFPSTNAPPHSQEASGRYRNPKEGYCYSWLRLTHQQREAATVYALGKLLWCIFEGQGSVCRNLRNTPRYEPTVEFPEFRASGGKVRELIWKCTWDAPEWRGETERVVRVDGRIEVLGKTAREENVLRVAREWWMRELTVMEEWLTKQ